MGQVGSSISAEKFKVKGKPNDIKTIAEKHFRKNKALKKHAKLRVNTDNKSIIISSPATGPDVQNLRSFFWTLPFALGNDHGMWLTEEIEDPESTKTRGWKKEGKAIIFVCHKLGEFSNRDEALKYGVDFRRHEMDDRNVEILVHISAPSKVINDAEYRAIAQSYLNFNPGKRTQVFSGSGFRATTTSDAHIIDERQSSPGQPSFTADQGQVINSPELSFRSVLGNAHSPRPQQAAQQQSQVETQGAQSSWVAPPSVIQDSLPDNTCALSQFRSPTRILEHYISGLESSQSEASPNLRRRTPGRDSSFNDTQRGNIRPGAGPTQSRAPPTQNLASIVQYPDTQFDAPTSSFDVEPRRASGQPASSSFSSRGSVATPSQRSITKTQRNQNQIPSSTQGRDKVIPASPAFISKRNLRSSAGSRQAQDETHITASFPTVDEVANDASRIRADSEPAAKRPRVPPIPSSGKPLARSSSDIGPGQEEEKSMIRARRNLSHLEIISPPPPAAMQNLKPEDLITQHLGLIAERFGMKERYKPSFQTRELRPFERGYWALDCSSWEQSLKEEAWDFLTTHIGQGLVGWGTTCKRDRSFTSIRLYCWGCVVGHMYLLLWAASRRQARYAGMTWIAGDGKTVVVVEPRPQSR
ncbi:hypothetical protein OQA88_6756 [Cercophora sp. LCS_1]